MANKKWKKKIVAPVSAERSVLEKRLSEKGTTEPCLLAITTTLNLCLCLGLTSFGKEVCASTVDNPRQTDSEGMVLIITGSPAASFVSLSASLLPPMLEWPLIHATTKSYICWTKIVLHLQGTGF